VAIVSGREIEVSWLPPVWDGGFPLHHYALTLRRWDAPQQRWERVPLDGHPAELEVPATLTTATTAIAATGAIGADADDDDAASGGGGGGVGSSTGLQAYRLGTFAPAEYRAELRAVNTQGDASARALSVRVRVPGGWCGWEAAEGEGGLTCNESVALIAASGLAALGLAVLAGRRYVLGRRGQGQPLLWHGRAIVDDGGEDVHELNSIREETLVGAGLARARGREAKPKATLWQGAGGGGAAGGGGPGAEAMRLRLEELRLALYLL
jgi:hypothetical protein